MASGLAEWTGCPAPGGAGVLAAEEDVARTQTKKEDEKQQGLATTIDIGGPATDAPAARIHLGESNAAGGAVHIDLL